MGLKLTIPEYPYFAPFSLSFADKYKSIYLKHESYSEFSFANLAIWLNVNNTLELSTINDNFLLKFDLPDNPGEFIYEIYGNNKVEKTFLKILQDSKAQINKIEAVPEFMIDLINDKDPFCILEDRDNWEYVYSSKDLSELVLPEQARNRRKVRRFERENGANCKIETANLNVPYSGIEIREFIEKTYKDDFKKSNDNGNFEIIAIENTLKYPVLLNIQNIILRINNNIEGFLAYHISQNTTALVCHIKVNYHFNNIFDYLVHILATQLNGKGIKYINLEQDLGIEGLRIYKTRLKPIKMQKKYIVSLNK